ncbi:ribonuclease E inhibitor RraB [Glaciecola sp. XM2]|jgi:regulator of RNase E activity RraB|uniref:ribonuclease E inhibitor RraB n=1 Tax=Glaciecola sp. XM2 TaxID=1914931 RepID=UPI001BDED77F|nr:ribonuclease E inhibitor RraB [Glaciecola sp. XM2]MBT1452513.1 ribonuclease E inhibitor RraB [Glaciecola sp. XM2]
MNDDDKQAWYEFNEETIEALTLDGSDISQPHIIEHHFASKDFDILEKAAVEVFKAGFEVTDAEELVLDDGGTVFCFDAIVEKHLNLEAFNKDTDTLLALADKNKVHYDGWGTYYVGDDAIDYEDGEFDEDAYEGE